MIDENLCACGTGLRALRCCQWNKAAAASRGSRRLLDPTIQKAVDAKTNGNDGIAEAICLEVLELSPGEIDCLKVLADLRRATLPRATEVLLRRIVALDPDDWKATFDFSAMLFGVGNFSEAELHARNALRPA